ncbi:MULTISPECIES: cytochrome c [Rhodomicrobium]|uniref:c-type cytochrome n=1 Tax=Rhodomicrobium TaxID=1068 RepID=UPI000B4B5FF0|nr:MULTISPECIES: cytochrome c [Rhodomicrobium]
MKRIIIALAIGCTVLAGAAIAQESPIKKRQALMKQNGEATDLIVKMFKGETPYDGAAAAAALTKIGGMADEFITLFPEGTAKDSYAKPEIWQNKADFDSWAVKLKEDSAKAATAAAGGMDALQPAFAELGQTCRGCHEKYRVPQ